MADTLDVIKVVAEGPVTSFRYPYFIQGRHPTFEMPPPATIYGHICSAYGDWLPPESLRFAYHFQHAGRFTDYEHLHFREKNGELKLAPFNRDLLFNPRLALYVDRLDLLPYFHSPRYAVALGRSQDLMMYTSVGVVTLRRAEQTYFEGTLLSLDDAALLRGGYVAVTMPRYVDPRRQPQSEQYAMLKRPTLYPPLAEEADDSFDAWADEEEANLALEGEIDFWVDESETGWRRFPDLARGVVFHTFVEARRW
jgi:CRISPR-associated protein Cas5t